MTRVCCVLPLALLGACGLDSSSDPDEELIIVPAFRSAGVPGDSPGGDPTDLPASCLTRYDFADRSVPDVECRRAIVGEDPNHFVVTCPPHPQLPTTAEVERAADGRILRDKLVYSGDQSQPQRIRTYQYDAALRLAVSELDSDGDLQPNWRRTVLTRDPEGLPLTEEIHTDPWDFPGGPYPVTAHQAVHSAYDGRGRLTSRQMSFVGNGATFLDMEIKYNDRARRREWRVVVDDSSLGAQAGGPGVNRGYELFDGHGQLIERSWTKPDGERSVEHYRYDGEGRQTLKSFEGIRGTSYTAREVYRCP